MTLDDVSSGSCCIDASLRTTLEQARLALDAAVAAMGNDPEALSDEILAARLLVGTALLKIAHSHPR